MRLRRNERRIFFPWEGRVGLRRWLALGRVRPFVIGLLAIGFVVFVGLRERRRAGIRHTRGLLMDTRGAIDRYMADHDGGCPPSLKVVADYGPFEQPPRDAWGRPLRLICPARREGVAYQLMSDGPDGKPGGLDRID